MSLQPGCRTLHVRAHGDTTVATLNEPHFSECNSEAIGEALLRLVEGRDRPVLHLDLAGVGMVTSAGLGTLVTLHKYLKSFGGHLVVHNVRPHVHEVFTTTRLTQLFDVEPQDSEARVA